MYCSPGLSSSSPQASSLTSAAWFRPWEWWWGHWYQYCSGAPAASAAAAVDGEGSSAAGGGEGSSAAGGGEGSSAAGGGEGSSAAGGGGGSAATAGGGWWGGSTASDREYRNKVQGFSFYLFRSQQAKCTFWQVSHFYT